jgi:hypothetical protein
MKKLDYRRRSEKGIALLIAIFVLLLISVVAIALLVSSGTETALGANYRSSSTVYYAALAGLEEARGRLLPKNPNYLGCSLVPSAIPSIPSTGIPPSYCQPIATLPIGSPVYITNALPGEVVAPADPSNPYYDSEYGTEFPSQASQTAWQSTNSVWNNNVQGIPGPPYKWVRINAVNEQALYLDVNNNGAWDTPALFYDVANVNLLGNPAISLIVPPTTPPATAFQALEITSFAHLPNGSQKYLQYIVAPAVTNFTFPGALTLDGYNDSFTGTTHPSFAIHGDYDSYDSACGGPTTPYPVPAIAVPDQNPDGQNIINAINSITPTGSHASDYTGPGGSPSVQQFVSPFNPSYLQSPATLDAFAQFIMQNADVVIAGPANQTQLPTAMSPSNPMTVAIVGDQTVPSQGNFDLGPGFTGYGLLLVTGNLTYSPDANWYGVILVIGQGNVSANTSNTGGTFTGAMLVANTRSNSNGALLTSLGPATFSNTQHGNGITYSCSWIETALAAMRYKILSFRELRQP